MTARLIPSMAAIAAACWLSSARAGELSCEASNLCANQRCIDGVCETLSTVFCPDDGDPCTIEFCDPSSGECSSVPKPCFDDNPCTTDTCNSATGDCVFTIDDGNSCDLSNPCASSVCSGGTCVPGTPVSSGTACTPDFPCLSGECNGMGFCVPQRPINELQDCGTGPCMRCESGICSRFTGSCNDDNLCTTGDTCDGEACVGTPVSCAPDDDLCTTEECNPFDGQCESYPTVCPPDGQCSTASCDPTIGCQTAPAEDGSECTDFNPCTNDECVAGECISTGFTTTASMAPAMSRRLMTLLSLALAAVAVAGIVRRSRG